MADLLPGFEEPPARARRWHNYENYRVVHEEQMQALFERGIVVSDDAQFIEGVSTLNGAIETVQLLGRITVASGAMLSVDKWLSVRWADGGRLEVLADRYAYNAWMPGEGDRELFRYDNCYGDVTTLHRHRFYLDGTQHDRIEPVPYERMPYLNAVIEEAHRLGAIRSN